MFSGWGVRTIAAGLARYGHRAEASHLAVAVLEAARCFGDRLPEVLLGTDRRETRIPVRHPTACCPQAWAAGTPLLLIRVMLGLRPDPLGPEVDPYLPERIEHLALDGVPGQWGRADSVGASGRTESRSY
jgi:glycogen debranching enzyme